MANPKPPGKSRRGEDEEDEASCTYLNGVAFVTAGAHLFDGGEYWKELGI